MPATARQEPPRLFIYSRHDTAANSWKPVHCGGRSLADLKKGYYFATALPAGRYTCSLAGSVPLTFDLPPSGELYLRLDWHHRLGRPPIPILTLVAAPSAIAEIRLLSYLPAKRARSPLVSPRDPRPFTPPQLKTRDPE